ncbi:hypothetical protein DM02DRAFT_172986 [Periconia macrospinosa]|uniref:Uncharacterized protein n=1 Tax=Periconia macrospinosa TaxID=97972 RepID=A0A2V1D9Y7_9PLEO|nr:hypothetical protein DM02DRAFT_172986 [Periconia macrospinosa]
MPIDRNNTNTSRPLKPTLATNRTAKTPVTPRLALAPTTSGTSTTTTTRKPRSVVGSAPRIATSTNEDVTPVKSLINSNVTPRSSARTSRVGVGSAQSTPTGTPSVTPITSRPTSTVDYPQKEQGYGYGAPGAKLPSGGSKKPRSVVGGNSYNTTPTPRPPLSNIYNHAPDVGARSNSPMFFHVNDARTVQEQPPPQKKGPVFFYANGEQDEGPKNHRASSPPLSSLGRPRPESKFFHADSISEAKANPSSPPPPPILTPPPALPTSPGNWPNHTLAPGQQGLRPPSPSKDSMHLSYRKGVSQVLRPNLHRGSSGLSIFSGTHTPEASVVGSGRRSSGGSSIVRMGHGKSASLSSIDSTNSLKKVPSQDLTGVHPSPLHHENMAASSGSLPENVASASAESGDIQHGLSSPNPTVSKPAPGQSMLEHMNELAANARRERKVLDLEISNSSLLAINRSLEREVRKQKAELRRFRRMTRAGRFSADTVIINSEEYSVADTNEFSQPLDISEEEEEDEPEDSSESSFDESVMSPEALEERDAAHRLRDEKRLRLDLSKHRELLVDSQKMNQSLGRCLTWTEELIKDAQKALAFQVRVSDVQLGGRVLSADEQQDADQEEDSKALLSPWTPPHRAIDIDSSPLLVTEGKERDSGVDLDSMHPLIASLPGFISPLASPLQETSTLFPLDR